MDTTCAKLRTTLLLVPLRRVLAINPDQWRRPSNRRLSRHSGISSEGTGPASIAATVAISAGASFQHWVQQCLARLLMVLSMFACSSFAHLQRNVANSRCHEIHVPEDTAILLPSVRTQSKLSPSRDEKISHLHIRPRTHTCILCLVPT